MGLSKMRIASPMNQYLSAIRQVTLQSIIGHRMTSIGLDVRANLMDSTYRNELVVIRSK